MIIEQYIQIMNYFKKTLGNNVLNIQNILKLQKNNINMYYNYVKYS